MDISIIISIIALLVSGIVAWKNYLSPFNVKIFCGNPRLEPMPLKLENGETIMRFSPILPLYFVNTGAKDGIINDIILEVNSEKNKFLFQPFFYTEYNIKKESPYGKKLTENPFNEPFYPLHLEGNSKTYRPIAFAPLVYERFPLGTNHLMEGNYNFQVKIFNTSKQFYEIKLTFNTNLSKEQIDSLSRGDHLIPFLEKTKKERERL